MGRRMPFLVGLTLLSVFFTALIGACNHLTLGLIFFVLANYGYHAALVPYDALLPQVSRGFSVGKVAGIGVALGYVGAIAGIVMVKPFVTEAGQSFFLYPYRLSLSGLFTALLFLRKRGEKKDGHFPVAHHEGGVHPH